MSHYCPLAQRASSLFPPHTASKEHPRLSLSAVAPVRVDLLLDAKYGYSATACRGLNPGRQSADGMAAPASIYCRPWACRSPRSACCPSTRTQQTSRRSWPTMKPHFYHVAVTRIDGAQCPPATPAVQKQQPVHQSSTMGALPLHTPSGDGQGPALASCGQDAWRPLTQAPNQAPQGPVQRHWRSGETSSPGH